jgi:hypothetical protein
MRLTVTTTTFQNESRCHDLLTLLKQNFKSHKKFLTVTILEQLTNCTRLWVQVPHEVHRLRPTMNRRVPQHNTTILKLTSDRSVHKLCMQQALSDTHRHNPAQSSNLTRSTPVKPYHRTHPRVAVETPPCSIDECIRRGISARSNLQPWPRATNAR